MLAFHLVLLVLFGCDASGDSGAGDSTDVAGGVCNLGPSIDITSPASAAVLPVGQAVALTAEAESEVDSAAELRILWAVAPDAGDTDNVGTGLTQSWTPTEVGIYTVFVQIEDSCTDNPDFELEPVQDSVKVEVE